jgi:hypothetical protein
MPGQASGSAASRIFTAPARARRAGRCSAIHVFGEQTCGNKYFA